MPLDIAAMQNRIVRPDLPRIEVYGDESLARGPYDLLGMLCLTPREAGLLRRDIASLRHTVRPSHALMEVKWTKCSGRESNPFLNDFVDLVMERIIRKRAFFKVLVVDRALVDNQRWNGGDEELGFFKAWHTLLRSRIQPGVVSRVWLDARQLQKRSRLEELRDVLNRCGRRDHFAITYDCCSLIESRDSKADDLIQATDILIGAVGYHYSRAHLRPGASPRKVATARRIAEHLGKATLTFGSPPSEEGFNIWRWKPRNAKARRAS